MTFKFRDLLCHFNNTNQSTESAAFVLVRYTHFNTFNLRNQTMGRIGKYKFDVPSDCAEVCCKHNQYNQQVSSRTTMCTSHTSHPHATHENGRQRYMQEQFTFRAVGIAPCNL